MILIGASARVYAPDQGSRGVEHRDIDGVTRRGDRRPAPRRRPRNASSRCPSQTACLGMRGAYGHGQQAGLTGCRRCLREPVVPGQPPPSRSRSSMTSPTVSTRDSSDPAAMWSCGLGQVGSLRPDRSSRVTECPPTTDRVALGVRSRSDALAGQLLEQRPNLGLEEPSVSTRRPDAVNPAGGRPPRHRLRVDAEQCSHLTRREQSLPWVHSLPLVLDSHAVQGQGSARADTQ